MSLANDLLYTLSESQTAAEDDTLIIDHYTRSIIIPKTITNLGVENDDDVLRLKFKMPRYLGKVDLSTFSIRINYINANGDSDVYKVTDATVTTEYITFTWLVGPVATAYKGNTKFIVCMVVTDSEATIQNEYNTSIATLPVLEGLEVDEGVISEYSDILEQWEQRLFDAGDSAVATLQAQLDEDMQYLRQAFIAMRDTIPGDFWEVVDATDNADRTKSDAIVLSSQGEVVTVSDSSDDHIRGLKIFGKTMQVHTEGNQLADFSKGETNDGVTVTFKNDVLKVTGNGSLPYQNYGVDITEMFLSNPGKTLYFACKTLSSINDIDGRVVQLNIKKNDNTWTYIGLVDELCISQAYKIPDDVSSISSVKVCVYTTNAASPSANTITIVEPMLQFDTYEKDYEPYSKGFASPSPDYAQPLNSVVSSGNLNVNVFGKNLCDPSVFNSMSTNGTTTTYDPESHTITATAAGDSNPGRYCQPCRNMIIGQPYTISFDVRGTSGKTVLCGWDLKKATITLKDTWVRHMATVIATRSAEPAIFYTIPTASGGLDVGEYFQFANVQIEYGDKATAYEEYKAQQTITVASITTGLPGIPVESDGNYTDSTGQQWVCDEIDFERGVYVKRINTVNLYDGFTGHCVFSDNTKHSDTILRFDFGYVFDCKVMTPILCNKLVYDYAHGDLGAWARTKEGISSHSASDIITVFIDKTRLSTPDLIGFEEYLLTNDIIASYVLANPIETPLTAEEIVAFKAMYTNSPNTTVINNAGAVMELKYNADTKTYLEQLPKATDDQVQNSVDAWLTANKNPFIVTRNIATGIADRTFAEIKAAYDSNNVIFLKYGMHMYYCGGANTRSIYFYPIIRGGSGPSENMNCMLTTSNEWTTSPTEIPFSTTYINKNSDDARLPTAKAVWDAIPDRANPKYELIQSLEVTEPVRKIEFTGLNLDEMTVFMQAPLVEASISHDIRVYNTEGTNVFYHWPGGTIHTDYPRNCCWHINRKKGYVEGFYSIQTVPSKDHVLAPKPSQMTHSYVDASLPFDRIKLDTYYNDVLFPVGLKIEIWGLRADA